MNARRSLARLARLYCEDKIDRAKVTALAATLNTLLGYFRTETELDTDKRLEALERRIDQAERRVSK